MKRHVADLFVFNYLPSLFLPSLLIDSFIYSSHFVVCANSLFLRRCYLVAVCWFTTSASLLPRRCLLVCISSLAVTASLLLHNILNQRRCLNQQRRWPPLNKPPLDSADKIK